MLISYSNNIECFVLLPVKEVNFIKDYFTDGGRDLDDYDREEHESNIVSSCGKIHVSVN